MSFSSFFFDIHVIVQQQMYFFGIVQFYALPRLKFCEWESLYFTIYNYFHFCRFLPYAHNIKYMYVFTNTYVCIYIGKHWYFLSVLFSC